MSKTKRTFINMNEAWWSDTRTHRTEVNVVAEICLSLCDHEGTIYEFMAEWHALPGPTLRLCVFRDGFDAFVDFADLFAALHGLDEGSRNLSPADFCALLESMGIEDVTKRKRPDGEPAPVCPTCKRPMAESVDASMKQG